MKHYFIGGGIGALAGAAFLIRDANVDGADITLFEKHPTVFGGALERYPRIRFILPHAGGLIPYFSWRLSVSPMIDRRLNQMSQVRVFELLKRFWYDNALSPGEQTWGCLEHVASPEQIVFGTDWPHVMMEGEMPNTGTLVQQLAVWVPDEATRNKILVDNPARLYGF